MITYLTGDATAPVGRGPKVIAHICNDVGVWGAGFVLALSKKWHRPEQQYLAWAAERSRFRLGHVQYVKVQSDPVTHVANMIAQRSVGPDKQGKPPIRYDALEKCLREVNTFAKLNNASLHAPKFGAGLAGGDWSKIEQIVNETITVDCYVYNFDASKQS